MKAEIVCVVMIYLLVPFPHKITVNANHVYVKKYWTMDNAMIGRFTAKDQLFVKRINSTSQCAAECQKTPGCFSYFFHARDTHCIGNKNTFIGVTDSIPSQGFVLYKKDLSVCILKGYTYIPSIGTCFKFIRSKVSFEMAITKCAGSGGTSIRPDTNTKHNAVASYLASFSPDYCVWTEGNDRNVENSYRWADDTPITHFQWNSGEPLAGFTGPNDCITMWPSLLFKWDDISCNHGCYVLCELVP